MYSFIKGGVGGSTRTRAWVCPFCKLKNFGAVSRMRWHLNQIAEYRNKLKYVIKSPSQRMQHL
jgi:hypothetical protein